MASRRMRRCTLRVCVGIRYGYGYARGTCVFLYVCVLGSEDQYNVVHRCPLPGALEAARRIEGDRSGELHETNVLY